VIHERLHSVTTTSECQQDAKQRIRRMDIRALRPPGSVRKIEPAIEQGVGFYKSPVQPGELPLRSAPMLP